MRRSMAELIRSDSLHELLSEQFTDEAEEELILLQDDVTQTHAVIEKKKKSVCFLLSKDNSCHKLVCMTQYVYIAGSCVVCTYMY